MKLNSLFKSLCVAIATLLTTSSFATTQVINLDWRFLLNQDNAKAIRSDFDDSKWAAVDLPHDWAFEQGYSIDGAQGAQGGYASGGIGWYRKDLNFTKDELNGRYIFIDFDGVYMNSEVWINGKPLGKRPYGYISFSYDLTPYLKEGVNVLAVRVDNSKEPSARWYHGCGIYGEVRLRNLDEVYFEKDGLTITTPRIETESADTKITQEIVFRGKKSKYNFSLSITDGAGAEVAKEQIKGLSLKSGVNLISFEQSVKSPALWSPESPNLYYAEITISDSKGNVVESQKRHFGFRTIEWSADKGMFLNGEQYKLRGVCEHMEGGPTGAIATKKLWRWRLGLLKDMGCNAVRVAHNPYLPIFYEGMSCESAEWTRWSLEIEIQMDDRNGEMEAKAGPGDCFVLGLAYRCYMVWLSASKPG